MYRCIECGRGRALCPDAAQHSVTCAAMQCLSEVVHKPDRTALTNALQKCSHSPGENGPCPAGTGLWDWDRTGRLPQGRNLPLTSAGVEELLEGLPQLHLVLPCWDGVSSAPC